MSNPNALFLLADHIKLSLLERKRAQALNLDSDSQDGHISRSLEQFRDGLETLQAEQVRLEEAGDDAYVHAPPLWLITTPFLVSPLQPYDADYSELTLMITPQKSSQPLRRPPGPTKATKRPDLPIPRLLLAEHNLHPHASQRPDPRRRLCPRNLHHRGPDQQKGGLPPHRHPRRLDDPQDRALPRRQHRSPHR